MILIMKILLHNEYKIINLWYPTYVYQFFNCPYRFNYKNRVLACFQTRPPGGYLEVIRMVRRGDTEGNGIPIRDNEELKLSCNYLQVICNYLQVM